jgi:hypothetical protein
VNRKQSSKVKPSRVAASSVPAERSSWSWFEAGTIATILSVYAALLTHPIDLTVGDLGRHLKSGELVVQNRLIAQSNLFSYTAPDYPFINHHWGSGVVYYVVERLAGFDGLSVFFIAISVTTVWLFLNLAAKLSSFPIAAILAVVCLPILITRHEIRPEMFTYLLSGLFLRILWRYKQGKVGFRGLCCLPLLQLFWVNLHIYFFLGIGLVGLSLFESLIEQFLRHSAEAKSQSRQLFAILLGTVLVSFVNPAGVSGALYPLFIMQGFELPVIETYSVPRVLRAGFHFLPLTYFLIILGCLGLSWIFVFAKDRAKVSYGNLLLSVMVAGMAWLSIRNFALFAHFALPLAAANLRNVTINRKPIASWSGAKTSLALAGVALVLFLISPVYFIGGGRGAFGVGLKAGNRAAAEFFHRERLQGPVFNNFDIGGYLTYYLYPDQQIFVDNRPEAYPLLFFRNEYFPLQQNEAYWARRSGEYGFNVIVFNHRDRSRASQEFIVRRVLDPAWAPVFFDRDIIIFVRKHGSNHSTAEKYELATDQVLTPSN